MKTAAINITHPFIAGLHAIIMEEFGCCLCTIIGPQYSDPKFMAVFILSHFYEYRQRDLARAYSMNFHYVPTVVERHREMYAASEGFREITHLVLNKLDFYESIEESGK